MSIYRLYKQIIDTIIETNAETGDIIQPYNKRNLGRRISPTLTTRPEGLKTAIFITDNSDGNVRARRLTPRECYRLMGVDDDDIDKLLNSGLSDTKHWKLAGNSIVVDCMSNIFNSLFNTSKNVNENKLW